MGNCLAILFFILIIWGAFLIHPLLGTIIVVGLLAEA
jgi:hypothetical protein